MTHALVPPAPVDRQILGRLAADLGGRLPEVLDACVHDTERRVGLLAQAIADGDRAAAVHQAHTLKGLAATFGALPLRDLALAIERQAQAGDLGALGLLTPRLADLARETCAVLRAMSD